MNAVFGKVAVLALRGAWGLTKILFSLIFLPFILIGLVLNGLIFIALPVLIVVWNGIIFNCICLIVTIVYNNCKKKQL